MRIGRKLAIKILNVSRVRARHAATTSATSGAPTDPVDQGDVVERLDGVVADATAAFEAYDYARALERTEPFFWWFCDDYVELVKGRAYGAPGDVGAASARGRAGARPATRCSACSRRSCRSSTEEVWSWWQDGSIHRAPWPTVTGAAPRDGAALDQVSEVLAAVRKAKTDAKVSMRAPVELVRVPFALDLGAEDLREAGTIEHLETGVGGDGPVEVILAPSA